MRILALAIVTMVAAQLLDLATFQLMVNQVGAQAEANPLVTALFDIDGIRLLAAAKVAALAIVTTVVVLLAALPQTRARGAMVGVVLAAAIVAGIVGSLSNVAAGGVL